MQYIAIFFPGFVACIVQEKLQKEEYRGAEVIKIWGVYTFFINLFGILVYQYILKTSNSWSDNFTNNVFVIHYMLLSLIFAFVLPGMKLAINPFFTIHIERKDKREMEDGKKAD